MIELIITNLPYFFDLFMIMMFTIYRERLLFKPLAGGNGVVQMDELAKGIILVVFYLSARAEAFRAHEYHIFTDAYWYALLGCVAIIAGIKSAAFARITQGKEKESPKKATPGSGDDVAG